MTELRLRNPFHSFLDALEVSVEGDEVVRVDHERGVELILLQEVVD